MLKEDITSLFQKLEICSLQKQLPGEAVDTIDELEDDEIRKLITWSSIFSVSDETDDQILSFDILTRLLEIGDFESAGIFHSAEVILARLGNFPGQKLLRERYSHDGGQMSPFLMLESFAREAENSIFVGNNEGVVLTDFQYRFFESMRTERSYSVSAPTSAGKSFVLNLSLIERLAAHTGQVFVYLVPTRALISEVSRRLRESMRAHDLQDIIIRTGPFPLSERSKGKNAVFVFTQERLMSYLSNGGHVSKISALIVDEAHEIQNGKRGIILQNAIDRVLRLFPEVDVLFASPLIKNPGYFLHLFNRNLSGKYWTEKVSPVLKNTILVSEVKAKPEQVEIKLLGRMGEVDVGKRKIPFKFRNGKYRQQAEFAISISGVEDSVIVFSSNPSEAETVAVEISRCREKVELDDKIKEFIDFLKKDIHPEYPLIQCLEKGVAFHYGHMPSIVRTGVETFFGCGLIQFICCTSTLLQGVNLPAKHILIENPYSGAGNPMARSDFQNLSGRAGRLLKEFHGNVWCIRPGKWEEDSYIGEELHEVQSAMESVMDDGGSLIQKVIDQTVSSPVEKSLAEVALGKLYHDIASNGLAEALDDYKSDSNQAALSETLSIVSKIEITLPLELIEKNKALRPDHMQALYEHLSKQGNIKSFRPMSPFDVGGKRRMEEIFDIITRFFDWEVHESYRKLVSFIAYQWVRGDTIREILNDRVSYVMKSDPSRKLSSEMRKCLKILEQDIRFNLVRYFAAYIDVYKFVLEEQGYTSESVEPYHIYLEFGSCKWNALSLMALGMSRFTALYVIRATKINLDTAAEAEDYLHELTKFDFSKVDMPSLCRAEVQSIVGC
jgi:hypothetical protein